MSGHDLPPLAEVADLAGWVGETIEADDAQALAFLRGASARVRSYTGRTWMDEDGYLDDVPGDVHTVVLQVAARVWRNPGGYVQDTTGPFTVRLPERAGDGIYLTADEEDMLRPYSASRLRVGTLSITRGSVETDSVWVPPGSGPLLARDDL